MQVLFHFNASKGIESILQLHITFHLKLRDLSAISIAATAAVLAVTLFAVSPPHEVQT